MHNTTTEPMFNDVARKADWVSTMKEKQNNPEYDIVYAKCFSAAKDMRRDIINMTYKSGTIGAHIGGALSMVEIMSALFIGVMKYNTNNTLWDCRDRFILSKGHGAMALYAVMKQTGMLSVDDLNTFKKNETVLYAHPSYNSDLGIEFSSGSLGQGLSQGAGVALALTKRGNTESRVFALVGDGECNEGEIWEAAAFASHYRLSNLVTIVDKNGMQYDGITDAVLSMGNLAEKWESFGWEAVSVDGHRIDELLSTFSMRGNKPRVIIANTIKGKGVSFMENNPVWHSNRMNEQQYQQAVQEWEAAYD